MKPPNPIRIKPRRINLLLDRPHLINVLPARKHILLEIGIVQKEGEITLGREIRILGLRLTHIARQTRADGIRDLRRNVVHGRIVGRIGPEVILLDDEARAVGGGEDVRVAAGGLGRGADELRDGLEGDCADGFELGAQEGRGDVVPCGEQVTHEVCANGAGERGKRE